MDGDGGPVISSARLALALLGAVVILGVLGRGLRLISIGGTENVILGVGMVLVDIILLLATVRWWARWYFAACCLTTLRAVVMGALGRTISVPSIAAPRSLFAEVAAVSGSDGFS